MVCPKILGWRQIMALFMRKNYPQSSNLAVPGCHETNPDNPHNFPCSFPSWTFFSCGFHWSRFGCWVSTQEPTCSLMPLSTMPSIWTNWFRCFPWMSAQCTPPFPRWWSRTARDGFSREINIWKPNIQPIQPIQREVWINRKTASLLVMRALMDPQNSSFWLGIEPTGLHNHMAPS